jgi:tetratricopeptide (TPR) repeat protein
MGPAEFADWAGGLVLAYRDSRDADLAGGAQTARGIVGSVPFDHPDRFAYLDGLRQLLEVLFEETEDGAVLREAVGAARAAVRAAPEGGQQLSVLWHRLSALLWTLYQDTGDAAVLTEAIQAARAGIDTAADSFTRTVHLNHLGGYLYELFLLTEDLDLLRDAARVAGEVLDLVGPDQRDRPMVLNNRRRVLRTLFNRTGDVAALAAAVQAAHEYAMMWLTGTPGSAAGLAAALTPVLGRLGDDASMAGFARLADGPAGDGSDEYAESLGQSLFLVRLVLEVAEWGDRAQDVALLTSAVQVAADAVAAVPAGHPHRHLVLNGRWVASSGLGRHTGDVTVLTEGVQAVREMVSITPPDDPDRAQTLDDLACALRELAERTEDAAMLAEAAQLARAVVDMTPGTDPDRVRYLDSLRQALITLGTRTGDITVLAEAAQAAREAVAIAAPDDPDRAAYLAGLSAALRYLSDLTTDAGLLDEAVRTARQSVAAASSDDPFRAEYSHRLGSALLTSYERNGNEDVLAEAVRAHRAAVAADPGDPVDRAKCLSGLGFALRVLFERTGEAQVLAEAVQVAGDAVAAAPPGSPARAVHLTNFGIALQTQYGQAGELAILEQAVQAARDAVTVTPPGHTARSGYLSNLANGLRALFARTEDERALAESERAARAAVAEAGTADSGRVDYLGNLGVVLRLRFERSGEAGLLAESVRTTREAVAAATAGSAKRAGCLSNLADGLRALFDLTGDPAALAEAVRVASDAVAETPADQPNRTGHLVNLGLVLVTQARQADDPRTVERARACFAEAARNTAAPGLARIRGYREGAELALLTGGSAREALAELESAVALLPLVAARTLVPVDQQHAVASLSALAGEVAAAAVAAGRPGRAVELLEQTRGVLVADTLDALSSDTSRLREFLPGLAEEFDNLRSRLDGLNRADGAGGPPDLARLRRSEYAAWDDLVARIRQLSGFGDFLRPPDIRVLARQAAAGPVIFPYASRTGCGALIMRDHPGTPVTAVALDVTEQEVVAQVESLIDALGEDEDAVHDVLAWMWDAVARPVLNVLGHTAPPDGGAWPRVWWCPIGVFAYLPLHAAGHHRRGAQSVLDLVVSSYATTVRGMAYSRALRPADAGSGTVVVTAPDAPGAAPLPGAQAEAQMLTRLVPSATVMRHPTRAAVLAALPSCWVAHFACHGYADFADPAASQLVLYDHDTSPLTVADISALRLVSGLAYLSACSTAVTSLEMADEAVHLAGAFHLAGYQNVIGTRWPVGDLSAGMVAEDFYRRLTGGGTGPPDTTLASLALHTATRRLRHRFPGQPTHWAGYIHTGI